MFAYLRAMMVSIALAGYVVSASAEPFNSETTEMPGDVYDTDGQGKVVSAALGYLAPPHVYWSTDNGTSWVELNSPPPLGLHHDPREIHLREDGVISLYVLVGEWGPQSPWNNTPVLHWNGTTTYTDDLGETWGAWGSGPPAPAAAEDWQYYE